MHKSWLLCAFLGALAWGQTQPAAPPAQASPAATAPAKMEAAPIKDVPMSEPVLTIKGVSCPEFTGPTTAAGKTAAAATKPADCKITRAEFEKLAKALQQGSVPLNPQQRHQLATQLPGFIAMSEASRKKGLDKSDGYLETVKFIKIRILTQKLQEAVREEADKVPQSDIAAYYKANPEAFEQFSLNRLFIPRTKQASEDKDDAKEPEAATEEQQKAKDAADKAKSEKSEQELNELAETLRQRAAAGEDFSKLQKEAFDASGTKVESPMVNMPAVRRTGLPPAHVTVFELKVGEVSPVLSDNGGHYVYKVVSKEVLPLDDQVTVEIRNKLRGERFKEMMDKYSNSYKTVTNETYFGPAPPPGPATRMRQLPPTPRTQPQGAAQPVAPGTTAAPAQTPATQTPAAAPPAKPN
jgi:hypothetical protein